ncbi:calcium-binding protein [Neogemmobacter tilapiae]|uniref:Calcium-binding protein n=1 Tax=Neogemmobacter tilapiae TaxID=875041 RepID=A0A918TGV4_9RHOB|nr:calcium-binding protein [Gemmobacter tilapiae]GHC47817.1 hypothetical protein GCM10007315_07130 [Gemmobacter tilapiae]
MPTIRYFSFAPGTGASSSEYLSALFDDLVNFKMTATKFTVITDATVTTMSGSGLTYGFKPGFPIPFPAPISGELDSMIMKLKASGNTLWTIDNWNLQAKDLFDALDASDQQAFHNAFLGGNDRMLGTGFGDVLIAMNGNDSVYGGGGGDTLAGDLGADQLFGGKGNDSALGGLGHDKLFGAAGADNLQGSDGRDSLYGGAGSDQLFGDNSNDLLSGGAGGDILVGGTGADRFLFATPAVDGVHDNIGDFSVAVDRILLDNDAFTALAAPGNLANAAFRSGANATTAAHRILYDAATGQLWYDRDGSGAAAKVLVAVLDDGLAINASHFQIVG